MENAIAVTRGAQGDDNVAAATLEALPEVMRILGPDVFIVK
jgi:hypothetical protein